jgi:AcrR family transcriptional regulator
VNERSVSDMGTIFTFWPYDFSHWEVIKKAYLPEDERTMTPDKDKRTDILNAALYLFSENGFHGTPMTLLAKKANVGMGTIYRYFKNKEEVINALYKELKGQINRAIRENLSSKETPVREQFITIFKSLLEFYIQHPQKFKFIEQYSYSPFITRSTKEAVSTVCIEPLTSFFEYGIKRQVIKDLPIELIFAMANGPVICLAKMHLAGEIHLDEKMIYSAIETSWDALKK